MAEKSVEEYHWGNELSPLRRLRDPLAVKLGTRTSVCVPHNPSTIDQGQLLQVTFTELGPDEVAVPRSVRLAFNMSHFDGPQSYAMQ